MSAKKFYESRRDFLHLKKLTNTGISTDYDAVFKFAEDYHKEQSINREISFSDLMSQVFTVVSGDLVEIERGTELILLTINASGKHEFMDESCEVYYLDSKHVKRKIK